VWKHSKILSLRFGTLPVDILVETNISRLQAEEAKFMITNGTRMKLALSIITADTPTFWTNSTIWNTKFATVMVRN
jgi:hypothetical protein